MIIEVSDKFVKWGLLSAILVALTPVGIYYAKKNKEIAETEAIDRVYDKDKHVNFYKDCTAKEYDRYGKDWCANNGLIKLFSNAGKWQEEAVKRYNTFPEFRAEVLGISAAEAKQQLIELWTSGDFSPTRTINVSTGETGYEEYSLEYAQQKVEDYHKREQEKIKERKPGNPDLTEKNRNSLSKERLEGLLSTEITWMENDFQVDYMRKQLGISNKADENN